MVGALQSSICLYPAFRQRHQPAIHISSEVFLITQPHIDVLQALLQAQTMLLVGKWRSNERTQKPAFT